MTVKERHRERMIARRARQDLCTDNAARRASVYPSKPKKNDPHYSHAHTRENARRVRQAGKL